MKRFLSHLLAWRSRRILFTYDQLTPYVKGLIRGHWTASEIAESGWESAEAFLAKCEENYRFAKSHYDRYDVANIQYREGLITAQRETLGAIIERERREQR